MRRPGTGIGRRQQHPYRIRLRGHPLLARTVELAHFRNGQPRIRVIAEDDQRVLRARIQRDGSGKQHAGMTSARNHNIIRGQDLFRNDGAGRYAADDLADPHAHFGVFGREPQVHACKLHGVFQRERLCKRVIIPLGHVGHLAQGLRCQISLAHEHGLPMRPPGAGKRHGLRACGHVRRDGESALDDALVVCRKLCHAYTSSLTLSVTSTPSNVTRASTSPGPNPDSSNATSIWCKCSSWVVVDDTVCVVVLVSV